MKLGFFSFVSRYTIVPLVRFFLVKEVNGYENMPKSNFILVSNHSSYLDLYINGGLCTPKRFHFIGQVDTWKGLKGILVRMYYRMASVISIDRSSKNSKKEAVEKAVEVLNNGEILIIYPEGRRSRDGKIQQGRPGTARIFLKTGIPIVPVGIIGAFELMPPHKKFPKIKKNIRVNIGKPFYFEKELAEAGNLDEDSLRHREIVSQITAKIMDAIRNLAGQGR